MSDSVVATNQDIVTFIAEGRGAINSLATAMKKVNSELAEYLENLRISGKRPVVSSISHNCGFDSHIGYHASLVAVMDLH